MFKTKTKSFLNILWIELLNITNQINFIPIILIPLLLSLIHLNQDSLSDALWSGSITSGFVILCSFLLLWKVLSDIVLPRNMDKEIAMFLTRNKHVVFLAKILANTIIFIIPIFLFIGLTSVLILFNGGTFGNSTPTALRVFVFSISMIILYIFITLFINFILSLRIRRWIINVVLVLFVLTIFFLYLILPWTFPMMQQIFKNSGFLNLFFQDEMSSHDLYYREWVLYTPIINITQLYIEYFKHSTIIVETNSYIIPITNMNILLPLIFETIVMIGIIWIPMTKRMKTYLCT